MDRPILFSAPMVRALLEGRKTQTRRIAKFIEPIDDGEFHIHNAGGGLYGVSEADVPTDAVDFAPIAVGDRLWVREAWRTHVSWDVDPPRDVIPAAPIWYEAEPFEARVGLDVGKLRPSMFMPRWASRLTLTVTDVRVQRLQDISEEDARAEGAPDFAAALGADGVYPATGETNREISDRLTWCKRWYSHLWDEINGAGSWDANPWVAAYTFTVERRNIDEGLGQRADATPNPSPAQEG